MVTGFVRNIFSTTKLLWIHSIRRQSFVAIMRLLEIDIGILTNILFEIRNQSWFSHVSGHCIGKVPAALARAFLGVFFKTVDCLFDLSS